MPANDLNRLCGLPIFVFPETLTYIEFEADRHAKRYPRKGAGKTGVEAGMAIQEWRSYHAGFAEQFHCTQVNLMQKRRKLPGEKREELREELWPGSSAWLWTRQTSDGFVTIPRLLPWILHLIKHLAAGNKSADPSPAYVELWMRSYDEGIVTISDEEQCAYAAGYSSTRAIRTWSEHMRSLVDMGFILAKREGLREFGQVLILNPLAVAVALHNQGKTPDGWWVSFMRRAKDIGAALPEPIAFKNASQETSLEATKA